MLTQEMIDDAKDFAHKLIVEQEALSNSLKRLGSDVDYKKRLESQNSVIQSTGYFSEEGADEKRD